MVDVVALRQANPGLFITEHMYYFLLERLGGLHFITNRVEYKMLQLTFHALHQADSRS